MGEKYKPINEKLKTKIHELLKKGFSQKQVAEKLNVSAHSVFKVKNNIDVYKRGNLIQVDSVSDKLFNDLKNIAENKGEKFPEFIRKELRIAAEKYPEEYKKKPASF